MSSIVTFANGTLDRETALRAYKHTVTSGEGDANVAAINLGLGATATVAVLSVQITNSGNVRRAPQGAVTVSGSTVTVADSGLSTGEVIDIVAVGYAA
jgi:hypothetical protein